MPYELKQLLDGVETDLKSGFLQEDRRLNRQTRTLVASIINVLDGNIIRWLKKEKPLPKYKDDWERMVTSFTKAVERAVKDLDSRQLMVFNDKDYEGVKQCFTHMQFVIDENKEFILIVYQRSGDLSKLKDDLIFFGSVAHKFESKVKTKVRRIWINYGSLHMTA